MDKNFARLLATLSIVPVSATLSTTEIHHRLRTRGLAVSHRTVQRDLESLAAAFGIACDTRSKPYGWRWPKGKARLSVPGMDWPEALSFRLLQDYLSGLLPASVSQHLAPYFEQARATLGAHFRSTPIQRWPDKVRVISPGPGLIAPRVKRPVHEAVSEALLAEHQLEISYRAIGECQGRTHRVHPLGMVLEGNVLYLVASFYDYDEPRQLAMHRIEKALLLEAHCVVPDGFSLIRFVDEGGFGCGGDKLIQLDATWFEWAGNHLLQAQLSVEQKVDDLGDGMVRIRATVRHTERLAWWLLSFGARVEVHGPRSLRKQVADEHRAAVVRYERSKRPRKAHEARPAAGSA